MRTASFAPLAADEQREVACPEITHGDAADCFQMLANANEDTISGAKRK
jgi:hypothetical protein